MKIVEFLYEQNIFSKSRLKKILRTFNLKKLYTRRYGVEVGHTILRTPPYHCVFNPIEMVNLGNIIQKEQHQSDIFRSKYWNNWSWNRNDLSRIMDEMWATYRNRKFFWQKLCSAIIHHYIARGDSEMEWQCRLQFIPSY